MTIRLRIAEDLEEVREMHAQAFTGVAFPGVDHTFWIATDGDKRVGFCSAVYRPERGYVYLSSAAVTLAARGQGLQRRMIRTRVTWARKQGASRVITYTVLKNYDSMCNLLKCGFRFYSPETAYVGNDAHYFEKVL